MMRTWSLLTTLMMVAAALVFPAQAFHKSAGGEADENAQFKELIRQRELQKEKSRQKLMEKERPQTEPDKILVRVHERGDDPTKRDGSRVIATVEMTPEEVRNRDYKRMIAKARAHQKAHSGTAAQAAEEPAVPLLEAESAPPAGFNLNLIAMAILGLAAVGWWVMGPKQAT